MDDLMALWYEPAWVAYLIMMGGALVGFGALYKLYEVKKNAMR
jgi:predicted acetyltransferase